MRYKENDSEDDSEYEFELDEEDLITEDHANFFS